MTPEQEAAIRARHAATSPTRSRSASRWWTAQNRDIATLLAALDDTRADAALAARMLGEAVWERDEARAAGWRTARDYIRAQAGRRHDRYHDESREHCATITCRLAREVPEWPQQS